MDRDDGGAARADHPDIEFVETVYGDDDDQTSFDKTAALLQTYPDLKGIISPTTVGISAAARYLSTSEYKGKVALTGLGTPNQMREYVDDGTVTAFALWNPADLGYLAAWAAQALITGEITGEEGDSFEAGKLGSYEVGADGASSSASPTCSTRTTSATSTSKPHVPREGSHPHWRTSDHRRPHTIGPLQTSFPPSQRRDMSNHERWRRARNVGLVGAASCALVLSAATTGASATTSPSAFTTAAAPASGSSFEDELEDRYIDPDRVYSTDVRWWLGEASHTDETLLEEIQALYDGGFRGVELCHAERQRRARTRSTRTAPRCGRTSGT